MLSLTEEEEHARLGWVPGVAACQLMLAYHDSLVLVCYPSNACVQMLQDLAHVPLQSALALLASSNS
jgi:hypothetical protein